MVCFGVVVIIVISTLIVVLVATANMCASVHGTTSCSSFLFGRLDALFQFMVLGRALDQHQ